MIPALLLGRKGSSGFPGKNLYPVLGNPLAFYPIMAALKSEAVDEVFISTDDEKLMALAKEIGVDEAFSDHDVYKKVIRLGIPDVFSEKYGSQDIIMAGFGLDPDNIVKTVKNCLTQKR